MQDFSDFILVVDDMIKDFGSVGVLTTQLESGDYDPSTAKNTVVTADITVYGIIMDLSLQSNGLGIKDKTLIQAGDKICYLRPSDELLPILMPDGILVIDPADDRVAFGNVTYKVVTVKVLDPTSSLTKPIYFELYLRR